MRLRAEVTTATPLDDAYYARLQAQLEKMTGKHVVVDKVTDLASCDIVFCMVSTYDDVKDVIAGKHGLLSGAKHGSPRIVVDAWSRTSCARRAF